MNHRIPRMLALFVLALSSAVTVTVTAAAATDHKSYTDKQIADIINHDLSEKEIENVTVEVRDGVVTLRGQVRSLWEKDTAIKIAGRVHDVRDVKSQLTIEKGESDRSMGERLGAMIQNSVFYTMFDAVSGSVRDGVVTLTGWVTSPYKSAQIAESVSKVPGVQELHNQIKVLPVSPYDDELRARAANAIYNQLPRLANQTVPPIHIIVNNGRVTLVGIVSNNVERLQAERAVGGLFGVFGVDNQLRVEAS